MNYTIFDIETGPLPDAELARFIPEFSAPANYKDAEKIAAVIAEKQAEWRNSAALSALTGRVLAIGLMRKGHNAEILFDDYGDEARMLTMFWNEFRTQNDARLWVGHNIIGFDLPFLCRRSMLLGVAVPPGLRRGRDFASMFVDTMAEWDMGTRERISLNNLSKALRVGEKSGSGKDFAALWATDRDAALRYLAGDLELTEKCALKMGLINDSVVVKRSKRQDDGDLIP